MYRISQKRQSCSRFLKIPKLLRDDDEVSDDNEIKHFFLGGGEAGLLLNKRFKIIKKKYIIGKNQKKN